MEIDSVRIQTKNMFPLEVTNYYIQIIFINILGLIKSLSNRLGKKNKKSS